MRKLIHDGISPSAVKGTDLQHGLIEAGHDLFNDGETLPLGSSFIPADFLDESPANPLKQLEGAIDVLQASMFLHCFDMPTQMRACKRIIALLRPVPGSMILGRSGGVCAGAREEQVQGPLGGLGATKRTNYLHDVASFKMMWDDVGRQTGTRWAIDIVQEKVQDAGRLYFGENDHRWLRFEIVRL